MTSRAYAVCRIAVFLNLLKKAMWLSMSRPMTSSGGIGERQESSGQNLLRLGVLILPKTKVGLPPRVVCSYHSPLLPRAEKACLGSRYLEPAPSPRVEIRVVPLEL